MEVSIIFKIGAVGILVSVLSQVLKHSGAGRAGLPHQSGGTDRGSVPWILPYIYDLFDTIKKLFSP